MKKILLALVLLATRTVGAEEPTSNASPVQIEVEVRYVLHTEGKDSFEWLLNADPKASPVVDNATLLHLLRSKNTETLSAPRLVTWSGKEATVRAVKEYRIPTEYKISILSSNIVDDVVAVAVPGAFATQEVGTILKALPTWNPARKQIDVKLDVSLVGEPFWHDYGSQYAGSKKAVPLRMEMPFFPARTIVTTMSFGSGGSVVMGGMIEEKDKEKKSLFIIVTARIIDIEGKTLNASKP